MIGYLLIYQTCHELFVNYNFLVLVWIWLHACLSYDPLLGLVKLILCHVSFVTIQKPNRINNFKRWQTRVKFWLMSMRIWWVIFLILPLTKEQHREYELENSTCIGCLLSLLSDQLCDIYMHHSSAHELWDALDRKYAESDVGHELYVNDQYHEYKMVDDRSIMEQAREMQLLVGELAHFDCILPDRFMVGGIITKLSPSWKYFSMSLKHKKETMTVESLIASLDVEEKARSKDMPRSVPQGGISNANVVEGKSGGGNKNNKNWKEKTK
jgi:hypothetical protein